VSLLCVTPTTPLQAEGASAHRLRKPVGKGAPRRPAAAREKGQPARLVQTKTSRALKPQTGTGYRAKVSHYLETVRAVEAGQKAEANAAVILCRISPRRRECPPPTQTCASDVRFAGAGPDKALMSRGITFNSLVQTSNRTYPEIGVSDPPHRSRSRQ